MTMPFDPTGLASLMPGQQVSQAQLRYLTMLKMVREEFKEQDQYIVMTPKSGPEAVKCLTPQHAAQIVYDKEGRVATEDEIKTYKMADELARQEVQKHLDRHDLAKSVQRVLRD